MHNIKKKVVSSFLAFAITVGYIPTFAATETEENEGNALWLTEIYPNDISRSSTYGVSGDTMEFVEITNTSDVDISFNDGYYLQYEYPSGNDYVRKNLKVLNSDKSENVILKSGKSAVFWSYRPDIENAPTIEDFRKEMNISSDVDVFLVEGQNGFAEDNRGFAIADKDGNIVSHFRYTTAVDTADGLAVHLEIPDFGYEMIAAEQLKPTNAGKVYSNQLNGISLNDIPTNNNPKGLYITEIRPNDTARGGEFGGTGSDDLMEALELTNTTDNDIVLNEEYQLYYVIKEGSKKYIPITSIDGTVENPVIPAGKTAVIWCNRIETLGDKYSKWPVEADIRSAYEIPQDVPVYSFTNQNGLGNTNRGFEVRKVNEDNSTEIISYYFWDGASDLKDNRSVLLSVNPDGPKMNIYQSQAKSTLGVVLPEQLSYPKDDKSSPILKALEEPEAIQQGEFLRVPYYYEGTSDLPVKAIELYYKTSDMDSYEKNVATSFSIYNKYYIFIPSDVLLNAEYVDYYVKAKNAYRTTKTEVRRVNITGLDAESGLRANINGKTVDESMVVSGEIRLTAKNYSQTQGSISITIDGEEINTSASLEKGAFYTFKHTGIDSYFKNALTSGNEVIKLFAKHSLIPSDSSMAIMVDSKYFTYNEDGTATAELVVRPGTYGSTWEDNTDENNDDFNISDIALSLTDGTIIRPEKFVDENGNNLDYSSVISMGDSSGKKMQAKATFVIPAEKIDAVGANIDTAQLSDGEHIVEVKSDDSVKTFKLIVNNSESEETEENNEIISDLDLTVDISIYPVKASVNGTDDLKAVVYSADKIEDITVYEGYGDSTFDAAEKTDINSPTVSESGEFPYQIFNIPFNKENGGYIKFESEISADYNHDVNLYVLSDEEWVLAESTLNNGKISALIDGEKYAVNNQISVLLQARGTEFSPYTEEDLFKSQENNYSDTWDGTGVPEQYDFSFAWITDTQYYSEQYHDNFTALTNYITENREELGIEYLIHTGDIVDEWDEEEQYIFASNQLSKFEQAGIPYGVLGGNHDTAHGNERYELYKKYFGAERYESNSYYGETYDDNLGHYDLVSAGGVDFLMIYMSWDIYTDEIEWINNILAKYPDRKAFINIHGGINAQGEQSYFSNLLMTEVAEKNTNLIAILNGHFHGSSMNIVGFDDDKDGINNRNVYQICTDYQSAPEGGSGYFKMIYFDIENGKLYLNSYSPVMNDYNYYDSPKLDSYTAGDVFYDQDIAVLDVDFGRESKTLTVSDTKVYQYGDEILGKTNNADKEFTLDIEKNKTYWALAVLTDESDNIKSYSGISEFTYSEEDDDSTGTQTPPEQAPDENDDSAQLPNDKQEEENPKTGINSIAISSLIAFALSGVSVLYFKKKRKTRFNG